MRNDVSITTDCMLTILAAYTAGLMVEIRWENLQRETFFPLTINDDVLVCTCVNESCLLMEGRGWLYDDFEQGQWVFGRAMKNSPETKNKVTGVPHKKVSEWLKCYDFRNILCRCEAWVTWLLADAWLLALAQIPLSKNGCFGYKKAVTISTLHTLW